MPERKPSLKQPHPGTEVLHITLARGINNYRAKYIHLPSAIYVGAHEYLILVQDMPRDVVIEFKEDTKEVWFRGIRVHRVNSLSHIGFGANL